MIESSYRLFMYYINYWGLAQFMDFTVDAMSIVLSPIALICMIKYLKGG
jgi:hypothetical protein